MEEETASTSSTSSATSTSYADQTRRLRAGSVGEAQAIVKRRESTRAHTTSRNVWLLNRTHFNLSTVDKRELKKFKRILRATVRSLFTAITTISSEKVSVSVEVGLAQQFIAIPLKFIPVVGSVVSDGYKYISAQQLRKSYKQFSQYLDANSTEDAITDEFSAIVTSYYQAEILNPSQNITIFESIKNFVTTPRITTALKKFVNFCIDKYIKGDDDKSDDNDASCEDHWSSLIETIIIKLLAEIQSIKFEDIEDHVLANKLSALLTPTSNAPFIFNAESEQAIDFQNASSLARLALLAYDSDRKIGEMLTLWGYKQTESNRRYFHIFNKDIQGFVIADSEKIIVCFRGTATAVNVFSDVNIRPAALSNKNLATTTRVHAGFKNALDNVWPDMKNFILEFLANLHQDTAIPEIWLTGHSLGGALAALAALDCAYDENKLLGENKIHLYTFGQPRVGTEAFKQALTAKVKDYQRFVNYLDLVPSVPPGYQHGGEIRWLSHQGQLHNADQYTEAMQKLDRHKKRVIRNNAINLLLHTDNHSMVCYVAKLATLVSGDNMQNTLSYTNYNNYQFNAKHSQTNDQVIPVVELLAVEHDCKQQDDNDSVEISEEDISKLCELIDLVNTNIDATKATTSQQQDHVSARSRSSQPVKAKSSQTDEQTASAVTLSDDNNDSVEISTDDTSNLHQSTSSANSNAGNNIEGTNTSTSQPQTDANSGTTNSGIGMRHSAQYSRDEGFFSRRGEAKRHFKTIFNNWTDPCHVLKDNPPKPVEVTSRVIHGLFGSPFLVTYMLFTSPLQIMRLIQLAKGDDSDDSYESEHGPR